MKTFFSFLILAIMFLNCGSTNSDNETNANSDKPYNFDGRVIVSADQGKTWQPLDNLLPQKMDILSVNSDAKTLFIGTEKGDIAKIDLQSQKSLGVENVMNAMPGKTPITENRVFGIFSAGSGQYAFVNGEGLFRKNEGSDLWRPVNTPEGVHGISKVVEDARGSIYVACQYGLYRSDDNCKTWDRIFKYGYVNNVILHNGSLWVIGINGIHQSADGGKTWSTSENIQKKTGLLSNDDNSVHMFENNNVLHVFKRNTSTMLNPGPGLAFLYSEDNGTTWKNHPAEKYMKNQTGILDVFLIQNSIYYSTKNCLMRSDDNGVTWKKAIIVPENDRIMSFRVITAGGMMVVVREDNGC